MKDDDWRTEHEVFTYVIVFMSLVVGAVAFAYTSVERLFQRGVKR